MLTDLHNGTGTIREKNQDSYAFINEAGLAMVVDGSGPEGSVASELVLKKALKYIKENAHVFSESEAPFRLCEAVYKACFEIEQRSADSIAGTAALWIHRGQVSLCYSGTCSIIADKKLAPVRSKEFQDFFRLSLPVKTDATFALLSEGLTRALDEQYIKELLYDLLRKYDQNKLERFWLETEEFYNGDDRTLILARLEEADKNLGVCREIVLSTEIDREFSIPLWTLPAGAGLLAIVVGWASRRIKSLPGLFRYIK
jgi:serine/threonine protein phosphatase PrpC